MIDRISSGYENVQVAVLKTAMDIPKLALVLLESSKIQSVQPRANPEGVGTKIDIVA